MHARSTLPLFPVFVLSFLVFVAPIARLHAQQRLSPQDAAATIHRMPADREDYIRWQTECDATKCTLSADVLRGASGDPPDRTDHDQYITLSINLPRKSAKPDAVLLHLPPWAQKDQGLFLAFVPKPAADPSIPPELDADGATSLAFTTCDDESCLAQAPGGLIAANGRNIDVFDRLLHSDHLIVLFTSDGAPYRTSIALDSFHQAWERYQKEQLNQ